MITKKEAKEFTYNLTVTSLRRYAKNLTSGQISMKAGQKDVAKVRAAMEELAAKLEAKIKPGRVIDAG